MKSPTIGAAMLSVASDASFADEELLGKKPEENPKTATREAAEKVRERAEPRDPDSKPAEEEGVTKTNTQSSAA